MNLKQLSLCFVFFCGGILVVRLFYLVSLAFLVTLESLKCQKDFKVFIQVYNLNLLFFQACLLQGCSFLCSSLSKEKGRLYVFVTTEVRYILNMCQLLCSTSGLCPVLLTVLVPLWSFCSFSPLPKISTEQLSLQCNQRNEGHVKQKSAPGCSGYFLIQPSALATGRGEM